MNASTDWRHSLAKPTDGKGKRARSSSGESVDWNPALAQLDQLLDEADCGEEDSRISIVLPPPPVAPKQSLRPARVVLRVLDTLPPWGRVAVLLAAIGAYVVGRWRGWW
jgi:hypothetical protein